MDKVEAYKLIQDELNNFGNKQYDELIKLLDENKTYEVSVGDGKLYEIEITISLVEKDKRVIKITGTISDMNWYTFEPISESVLVKQ